MKNKQVAIVQATGANFLSIQSALARLDVDCITTVDPELIRNASHVILPGVGAAAHAMNLLKQYQLTEVIPQLKQPVLGICLGMQLLCQHSEEGDVATLNIFPLLVKKIKDARILPHMGWNHLNAQPHSLYDQLFSDIATDSDFYFVHSFAAAVDPEYTLATCDYGQLFSAAIAHNNFYGVQFHPEKSGALGLQVLKNFLKLSSGGTRL